MQRVFARMQAAARHDSSVLIVGETGTGKEVVARAIHYNGPRAGKPFVPVNCSAIPRELIESELFGHRKGAFTGASATPSDSSARPTAARSSSTRSRRCRPRSRRLLRVLQERRVRRVGDVAELKVDVRFLAATNRTSRRRSPRGSCARISSTASG